MHELFFILAIFFLGLGAGQCNRPKIEKELKDCEKYHYQCNTLDPGAKYRSLWYAEEWLHECIKLNGIESCQADARVMWPDSDVGRLYKERKPEDYPRD